MKNIKKSIFLTMNIIASIYGMDEFSPVTQTMQAISRMQQMMLSVDEHQKRQQRAMESHKQSQQIIMENHELGQQIARDNHTINQQQAQDRLKMAQDNHQVHQLQADHRQEVDKYNHAAHRRAEINKRLLDLEKQREERECRKATSDLTYYENQTKTVLAKAELKKAETEDAFRKCLVSHMDSSNLGSSGIPNVCENLAKRLRILGGGSIVKELTETFKE